jgi:phosphoglycolate phosphatase
MSALIAAPDFWENLRVVIFDLDGTLIDSKLDLANSVNATLVHFGYDPLPHQEIFGYIGQGAPMLVRRALGHTQDDSLVEKALPFFLGYYREHMLDTTVAYGAGRVGGIGPGRLLPHGTDQQARTLQPRSSARLGFGRYLPVDLWRQQLRAEKTRPDWGRNHPA